MNREQLSRAVGNIDGVYIAEAYRYAPEDAGSSERTKRMKTKRIVSIALAAALILALGAAGYAIYNLRVQDLVLQSNATEETEIPVSQSYDPLPGDRDMISLQGFADSPEYQAMLAWAEFKHDYDRDGQVLAQVGNDPTPWDEKYNYNGYGVYSQEMADRIDAIAAEYGLTLHSGGVHTVDSMAGLYERFGSFSTVSDYSGYYYDDGTFQCDCIFGETAFQLRRCMKGTLDTVSLNIGDAAQYEQWEYQTSCGVTVLLALGPNKALIVADLPDSFVVVNVLTSLLPEGSVFDAQKLEALSDIMDFSIL